jgi:hypothetical protein
VFDNWQVLVPTNTGDVSQLNFARARPPFAATVAGVSHKHTRPVRNHPCAIMIFLFNGLQSTGALLCTLESGQLGHFANSEVDMFCPRKVERRCADAGPMWAQPPGRGDPHGAIFSESLKNLDPAAFPSRSTVSDSRLPRGWRIARRLSAFNGRKPPQPPLVSCQLSAAFTISASTCF